MKVALLYEASYVFGIIVNTYSIVGSAPAWVTVQVADLPPWVALIVAVLLDVDVFSPNVKVLGEELLLRLPKLVDNVGLPVSSVTSPLAQYTVLLALAVIVEVPPLLDTLVGLADTDIVHSPYELTSSPLCDRLIVAVLLDSF
mgnify:FL=1